MTNFIKYRLNSIFYQSFKTAVITNNIKDNREEDNLHLMYLLSGAVIFGTDFNNFMTTSKIEALKEDFRSSSNSSSSSCSSSSCSSGCSCGSSCGSSCGGCGGGGD